MVALEQRRTLLGVHLVDLLHAIENPATLRRGQTLEAWTVGQHLAASLGGISTSRIRKSSADGGPRRAALRGTMLFFAARGACAEAGGIAASAKPATSANIARRSTPL
ncbi:MAG: hypothetical protein R2724_32015 [Bryobacterales bacterium]